MSNGKGFCCCRCVQRGEGIGCVWMWWSSADGLSWTCDWNGRGGRPRPSLTVSWCTLVAWPVQLVQGGGALDYGPVPAWLVAKVGCPNNLIDLNDQ